MFVDVCAVLVELGGWVAILRIFGEACRPELETQTKVHDCKYRVCDLTFFVKFLSRLLNFYRPRSEGEHLKGSIRRPLTERD